MESVITGVVRLATQAPKGSCGVEDDDSLLVAFERTGDSLRYYG